MLDAGSTSALLAGLKSRIETLHRIESGAVEARRGHRLGGRRGGDGGVNRHTRLLSSSYGVFTVSRPTVSVSWTDPLVWFVSITRM
jgi:hypothetical protein